MEHGGGCLRILKTSCLPLFRARWLVPLVFVSCLVYLMVWNAPLERRLVTDIDLKMQAAMHKRNTSSSGIKKILLWTPWFGKKNWVWGRMGDYVFNNYKCPVRSCQITNKKSDIYESDVVLFHMHDVTDGRRGIPEVHPPWQSWVFYTQECPPKSVPAVTPWSTKIAVFFENWFNGFADYNTMFNASMTYMADSDIYMPYGRVVNKPKVNTPDSIELKDFSKDKNGSILWFVSNCKPQYRYDFALKLQKHIPVDIFGACGRDDPCTWDKSCTQKKKKKYKFYLAFENNRCREYITEKLWGSLSAETIPIVMGATMEDYNKVAPPDSFIHVDNFTSVQSLALYLKHLSNDKTAYNRYHAWRKNYAIDAYTNWSFQFIACRLCEFAHNVSSPDWKPRALPAMDWFSPHKLCQKPIYGV